MIILTEDNKYDPSYLLIILISMLISMMHNYDKTIKFILGIVNVVISIS